MSGVMRLVVLSPSSSRRTFGSQSVGVCVTMCSEFDQLRGVGIDRSMPLLLKAYLDIAIRRLW